MAITFEIENGDVVMNTSNGRPKTIGNGVDENDSGQAIFKTKQDLHRCLSLESIRNGTTAGMQNLVGTVPQFGSSAISVLVNRRIRNMFSAILKEQGKRPDARPPSERFKNISSLRVFSSGSKTGFRFQLGVRTQDRAVTELSGTVG